MVASSSECLKRCAGQQRRVLAWASLVAQTVQKYAGLVVSSINCL